MDGFNWTSLDKINSKAIDGNSFEILNYTYEDRTRLNSDIIYYKLVQNDFDGTREESQIVAVSLNKSISISPNPFKEELSFNHYENIQSVEIFTYDGKRIYSESHPRSPIDTRYLKRGVYLIKLQLYNEVITERVIKE